MQHIVEELILFIPEIDALLTPVIHGAGTMHKMLEELRRDIFIGGIGHRQLEGHHHQVQAIHAHPAGRIALLKTTAVREWCAAIEDADIVEPEEAALKDVLAIGVLAIDHPGKVEQELMEDALQKDGIAYAPAFLVDLIDAPGGPGMHRRVDIAEGPLIGRDL